VRRWFGLSATWSKAAWDSRRLATCLWPGLAQLWFDGSWGGLTLATVFAAGLNVLLAVSLVWYELATPLAQGIGWLIVATVWLAAAGVSWRWLARRDSQNNRELQAAAAEDLYPAAMNEYLKRNFVTAERMAKKLLAANERDIVAGILLASVWRRTGRTIEAKAELERLGRLEASQPWSLEIERELARLRKITEVKKTEGIAANSSTVNSTTDSQSQDAAGTSPQANDITKAA
jgi:hypothetical protein